MAIEPDVGADTTSHYGQCLRAAQRAIDDDEPDRARMWFEAAEAAAKAAHALRFPASPAVVQQIIDGSQPVTPQAPSVTINGEAACRWCGVPVSQCRGHNICVAS